MDFAIEVFGVPHDVVKDLVKVRNGAFGSQPRLFARLKGRGDDPGEDAFAMQKRIEDEIVDALEKQVRCRRCAFNDCCPRHVYTLSCLLRAGTGQDVDVRRCARESSARFSLHADGGSTSKYGWAAPPSSNSVK